MKTEGPYRIALPGGPAGPFYGLVNPAGRVVAMQIPNKDDAEFLAGAPQMENLLRRIWEEHAVFVHLLSAETYVALELFILGPDG